MNMKTGIAVMLGTLVLGRGFLRRDPSRDDAVSTGDIGARWLTLVAIGTLMVGASSCRIPFDFCVGAPNLTIYPVDDSVHVGQTVELQAHYTQGFWPACASTWSSGNPKVLSVKASSTGSTTATGVAPGTAAVKLAIGNDEAVDTVTVVP